MGFDIIEINLVRVNNLMQPKKISLKAPHSRYFRVSPPFSPCVTDSYCNMRKNLPPNLTGRVKTNIAMTLSLMIYNCMIWLNFLIPNVVNMKIQGVPQEPI